MKSTAIRLSIVLTTFIAGINVDFSWRAQEYALLALLNEYHDACIRKDAEYFNRTLPDDFTLTRIDGSVMSKAQLVSHFVNFPKTVAVESLYLRGAWVSIAENRATVTGELVDSLRFTKIPDSVRHSFQATYVYEKRGGCWRLISIRLYEPE